MTRPTDFTGATMAFRDHDYRVVEINGLRAMPSARATHEPSPVSRSRPAVGVAIASKFAEQHQVDPDEACRDAVYAEIKDGLQRIVRALCIAVAVFAVVYFVLRLAVGAVS